MADTDGSKAAPAAKPNPTPKPVRPSKPQKLVATAIKQKKLGDAASNGNDAATQ